MTTMIKIKHFISVLLIAVFLFSFGGCCYAAASRDVARRVSTFLFILLDAVDYLFGNGADFFAGDIGMDGKGEDALGEVLCIWR